MPHRRLTNNQQILKNIEKAQLSIDFNRFYLEKYLTDGTLTQSDILDFYQRDDLRTKYKLLAKEIEEG